jgi:ADP-ribosylglycohydrolase
MLSELAEVGGDTDTIGSIAGQVAGSHLGYSRLPAELRELPPVREVLPLAEAFARWISRSPEEPEVGAGQAT